MMCNAEISFQINIEVTLDIALVGNLKEFVNHLTKIMHSSVPGSLVIWYFSQLILFFFSSLLIILLNQNKCSA